MAEVTINDIHAKCKRLSPRQIRSFLRQQGFVAPETGLPGMNPKKKYVFDDQDPRFQQALSLLVSLDTNPKRPDLVEAKAAKKAERQAAQ